MSNFYLQADKSFMDYNPVRWTDKGVRFRGSTATTMKEDYGVFIGAGQTFGRFVEDPFPDIVSRAIGIPSINLGMGGAGPGRYLNPDLKEIINGSRFCVVQVMSGRSSANDLFDAKTGENFYGLDKGDLGRAGFARKIAQHLITTNDEEEIRYYRHELRRAWLSEMWQLVRSIEVPKLLFYISKRSPEDLPDYKKTRELGGAFPQFIDRKTLNAIIPYFNDYAECVSTEGSPHSVMQKDEPVPLDMGGGRMVMANTYYPSPQMHEVAAEKLVPVVSKMLKLDTHTEKSKKRARRPRLPRASSVHPNFLVIGAAKSGTSALVDQMRRHPDIFVPPMKEVHHFDRLGISEDKDKELWKRYRLIFSGGLGVKRRGEATVAYTMSPLINDMPKRIADGLGDKVKFIYMVRDPVDRIISQFRHAVREEKTEDAFDVWLRSPIRYERAILRSNYEMQVAEYEKVFGQGRVKVVFYEDFKSDHISVLKQVFEYLKIETSWAERIRNVKVNRTSRRQVAVPEISGDIHEFINDHLKDCSRRFLLKNGKPEDYWPRFG